jgi:polygalacturonase
MKKLLLKTFLLLLLSQIHLLAKDYNASLFGIKSDGVTLNTPSIQKAIDFISEKGGGKLKFYVGRYLTGTVQLKSNVIIELNEGAVLVGTTSIYDYSGVNGTKALLIAEGQKNIGVLGKGVSKDRGRPC